MVSLIVSLLTFFFTWTYAIGNKVESKADKEYVDRSDKELLEEIKTKAAKDDVKQMQQDLKDIRQWVFEMYKEDKQK